MIAGQLEIQILSNLARLHRDMGDARRTVGSSMSHIEKSVQSAKRVLGTLGAGLSIGVLFNQFKQTAVQTDLLRANLQTMTGSVDAAGVAFDNLTQFASRTPFTLDQSVNAFIKLKALGLDPSERALASYGNTAAAMGKDMNQMIEAVADASTMEFERLKEFGIKARQQGDEVSFTFQGVTTTVQKNAEQIQEYLLGIGENTFGDAMANQMDRLPGLLSNLQDSVDGFFRRIADRGGTDAFGNGIRWMSGLVQGMTSDVDQLADFVSDTAQVFSTSFAGISSSTQSTLGILDDAFGRYIDAGIMSLNSFRFAFLDTFDVAGEKGIGTAQGLVRAWNIGFTNIIAATQNLGVRVGSTMDHIANFFGMSSKSAMEFAEEIERIRLASTGAQSQIQSNANATFAELDALRDEMIANRQEMEAYAASTMGAAGATAEMTYMTEGFVGPLQQSRSAMVQMADTTTEANDQFAVQINLVENLQREWANLINTLFSGKTDIGDFFDVIAKGGGRALSEALSGDAIGALTGKGGGNLSALIGAGSSMLGGAGSLLKAIIPGGANSMVAPATAANGLMSGVTGFLTSPAGIAAMAAIAGKVIHDATNDPDGRHRGMAGFLAGNTPGAPGSSQFSVDPFASGFAPVGFADGPMTRGDAEKLIEQFRFIDQTIVDAVIDAGGKVATPGTLGGFGLDGTGSGTFFGMSDITTQQQLQQQLDNYAQQIANHIEGLSPDVIAELMGASSAQEIVSILGDLKNVEEGLVEGIEGLDVGFNNLGSSIARIFGTVASPGGSGAAALAAGDESPLGSNAYSLQKARDRGITAAGSTAASQLFGNENYLAQLTLSGDQLVDLRDAYVSGNQSLIDDFIAENPATARRLGDIFDPSIAFGSGSIDGSHRDGIEFVPFDGYRAELHKGERVQTASEVKSLSREERLLAEINGSMKIMTKLLKKFDKDGMPQERT
ncbi:MAG: hypothetical protein RKH07_12725 [Gammaproteobacteria bacterium]